MKPLILTILSMSLLTLSPSSATSTITQKDLAEKTLTNIAYGNHPQQVMDVYLPKDRSASATKALVLIHGGGWNGGDKSEFTGYIETFKKRLPGWAIFNVNYWLVAGGHLLPSQENDLKSAVDFIVPHATEYGINKEKMAMLGVSAGAHLALLQSYKQVTPSIKAVVDYFGPTDLLAMYHKPLAPPGAAGFANGNRGHTGAKRSAV